MNDAPTAHDIAQEYTARSSPEAQAPPQAGYRVAGMLHNWPGYSGWFLAFLVIAILFFTFDHPYYWLVLVPLFGLCYIAGYFLSRHYAQPYRDGQGNIRAKPHSTMGVGVFFVLFLIMTAAVAGSLSSPRDAYEGEHIQEIIVPSTTVHAGDIVNITLRLGAFTNEPVYIELSFEHSSGFDMTKTVTIKKSVVGVTNIEAPGRGTMRIKARPMGVDIWEQELTIKIL